MVFKVNKKFIGQMLLAFALFASGSLWANKIIVSSASQLKSAAVAAQPGDTVEVVNGVYDTGGSITMHNSGTPTAPIVIRARQRQGAELTGDTYFNLRQCAYVVIEGFLFTSTDVTAIKLEACNNIRVTRNVFRLGETSSLKWVIVQGIWNDPNAQSHHNRIDHNLFEEKHMPGNFITIDGSGDPVYQSSQYDVIAYNHFRNIGPRHPNEMEAVRIGWSELSMSSGFTVVEYNLFEDCDGDPEIISVKTSDDTVRYNTFRRCQGTLSLRHGNRSVVAGNFFFGEGKSGTGGVRIYGDDHKIYNNYFTGLTGTNWDAPITLTNGDYDGGGALSRHWRINRAVIVHNTLVSNDHHIEIGFTNNGNYTKPPRDVVMANNLVWGKKNELVRIITPPVNMMWHQNLMFPDSVAVLGTTPQPGEIFVADPQMQFSDSLWQITAASPAVDSAMQGYPFIVDDFTGQLRDSLPDIGADEFAATAWLRKPLHAADVGPGAPEITTGIAGTDDARLNTFALHQNYPNPFNPSTTIRFTLMRAAKVQLDVFNVRGERVARLLNGQLAPGEHSLQWDAGGFASGIYFYRLKTSGGAEIRKMVLMK